MKTRLLCFFLIAFGISTYSQKKSLNIEGAWRLVQYQTINGNSVVNEFPGKNDIDFTKIWSGTHIAFVGRNKTDTTDWYGVGTYKLEGNRYEENASIHFYKPWEGITIKMLLEMKSDTLILNYPVNDKGEMDKKWANIEKYIRIKK